DAAGNRIDRSYGPNGVDANGNNIYGNQLLTETRYLVADPDGSGSGTASAPATNRFVYDAELHLRFSVSAEGGVTEYIYDDAGQVTTTIRYTQRIYDVSTLAPGT